MELYVYIFIFIVVSKEFYFNCSLIEYEKFHLIHSWDSNTLSQVTRKK